ncbi:glycoside hydrolase [Verrucomicrobia bacterium LW23]|nr:glycoside hydrolase [Verrucomicrobia bacterium LW23]
MPSSSPEVWGGIECTVNRVGDGYLNQIVASGHHERITDLDEFAALGFRTLRYPALWEIVQPDGPHQFEWSWLDERLSRLQSLGISPILGLLHHGSGPRWTCLLDPEFPRKLGAFARAVAERYPWVNRYTPVNEPLTTARFSGLYGFWYPHHRSDHSMIRILLNETEGTLEAMRQIRQVNPNTLLVQTEDLGKTFSTPHLRYQADFDNERRWLSFDLLNGRVQPGHPLMHFFAWDTREQLARINAAPCPPDIYGINYYITSERYLDERLDLFPPDSHGGNAFEPYADVEAIRVLETGMEGIYAKLNDTHARYGGRLVVSEAHLGSTTENQMRWLETIWQGVVEARNCGLPVEAVTVWALLGLYDWDSLVTRSRGNYEPGVYILKEGTPHSTEFTEFVRHLNCKRKHPGTEEIPPGWWEKSERLIYKTAG